MGHSRIVHHASALAALAFLSGCNPDKPDDRICSRPPSTVASGDMAACVHRWSYRLAGAPGSAEEIAGAVATACNEVANFNADKAPKNIRTETYLGNHALAETQAIFRVTQARAGHCEVP